MAYSPVRIPQSVIGSVFTYPQANQSVSGTVGASIIGTVPMVQSGMQVTSLVSTVPSSVIVGASIFGQLPAGTAPLGSVAVLQGTNPWVTQQVGSVITVLQSSSILAVPVGSVIVQIQANSIAGTYTEDSAHSSGDRGIFDLGVRNDAVASLASADLDYTAKAVDSAGRTIIKPFAADDSATFSFTSSTVSTSVMLIKASAIGKRNYITDFWLSNSGATTVLAYFKDGSTSIIGHGIAPAGGGESAPGINVPMKTAPSQDLVLTPLSASSVLYVTVNGYQAP